MRADVRGSPAIQWVLKLQVGSWKFSLSVAGCVPSCIYGYIPPPSTHLLHVLTPMSCCAQRAFASNNFVRFFALVRQAPYLLACLSHIYFGQVCSGIQVPDWPGHWCNALVCDMHSIAFQIGPQLPAICITSVACNRPVGLQVRGRALRTLGDTLAPKADTPVPLELTWLVVSCCMTD